jgi:hypothetical protein
MSLIGGAAEKVAQNQSKGTESRKGKPPSFTNRQTRQCTSGPKRLKHSFEHAGYPVSRIFGLQKFFREKITWY